METSNKQRLATLSQLAWAQTFKVDYRQRHWNRLEWNRDRAEKVKQACKLAGVGFEVDAGNKIEKYRWRFTFERFNLEWNLWTADLFFVRSDGEKIHLEHVHTCYHVLRTVAKYAKSHSLFCRVVEMVKAELGN